MRDTIDVVFNSKLTSAVAEIASNSKNSIDPIYHVIITVLGMLLVALITVFSQHLITKKTILADFEKINSQIKSDIEKIGLQVKSDFQMRIKFEWISNLRLIISELITTTDPDYNATIDRKKMLFLINQAQIMLNIKNEKEKELACMLTELGHVADYDKLEKEEANPKILNVQTRITEQTRLILREKEEEKIM